MGHDVGVLFRAIVLSVAALLPIVNPLGSAPIFLSMTPGASEATRLDLTRRITRNSLLLLAAALLVGSHVLAFFGLSLAVVKIAGGLLVISTGWRLVNADQGSETKIVKQAPAWGAAEIATQGFYPLTFPLTVGPGSVSVAITLGAGTRGPYTPELFPMIGVLIGIFIVAFSVYFSYRYAARIIHVLGDTGTVIVLRLSAFILVCIGVQIFSDGLAERFQVLNEVLPRTSR
jgi:multiple antibiotic resistance protein